MYGLKNGDRGASFSGFAGVMGVAKGQKEASHCWQHSTKAKRNYSKSKHSNEKLRKEASKSSSEESYMDLSNSYVPWSSTTIGNGSSSVQEDGELDGILGDVMPVNCNGLASSYQVPNLSSKLVDLHMENDAALGTLYSSIARNSSVFVGGEDMV
ncbi:hypothetical protein GH714_020850 [Hevea brasiliensis]|uniref:Uncharacterized protein n=1 Tax=Hevea brasiliensis TaxID=3981 RepID=A0A6A6L7C4_HEVBR|nr:hypothetical protein GH714_020850 [Hevea brasiliensis]